MSSFNTDVVKKLNKNEHPENGMFYTTEEVNELIKEYVDVNYDNTVEINNRGIGTGKNGTTEVLAKEELFKIIDFVENYIGFKHVVNSAWRAQNKGYRTGVSTFYLTNGEFSACSFSQGEQDQAVDATKYIETYAVGQNEMSKNDYIERQKEYFENEPGEFQGEVEELDLHYDEMLKHENTAKEMKEEIETIYSEDKIN